MQLLIYIPKVTPRIKYIFNFIFREVLICDFELTSIATDFTQSELPKFSYADAPLGNELFFAAAPLLIGHQIEPVAINETLFGEQRVPFAVSNSILPFDVFAASFYFLSRYEEYLPFEPDEHLRFPPEKSLQYQLGLLEIPVIDGWALILKNILLKKFPSLLFGKRKFKFVPTIDVDRAFYFRSNGLLKNTARFIKAAANFNADRMANILRTSLSKNEPFDTFDYLTNIHQQYRLQPIFFFLLAKQGHQAFDPHINPKNEAFKTLIGRIAKEAQIGLHPSSSSAIATKKLQEELTALQQLCHKKIDQSRQHFLKIQLPHTYLKLIKAGIHHDYSMGYAAKLGFRAGTCTSFFWYDLQLEKQTHLKIHPFVVMDVTLQQYLGLSPEAANQKIDSLLSSVKLVNGTFCSLWHNEALSETGRWKGWKVVYEEMLKNSLA